MKDWISGRYNVPKEKILSYNLKPGHLASGLEVLVRDFGLSPEEVLGHPLVTCYAYPTGTAAELPKIAELRCHAMTYPGRTPLEPKQVVDSCNVSVYSISERLGQEVTPAGIKELESQLFERIRRIGINLDDPRVSELEKRLRHAPTRLGNVIEDFERENIDFLSAQDFARLQMSLGEYYHDEVHFFLKGVASYIREGVIGLPRRGIILVRDFLSVGKPEKIIAYLKESDAFCEDLFVDDDLAEEWLERARDKKDDSAIFVQPVEKAQDYCKIPTRRFGEEELTTWLFGDLAADYGDFLGSKGVKEFSYSFHTWDSLNHRKRPFANWLVMGGYRHMTSTQLDILMTSSHYYSGTIGLKRLG